MRWLIAMSSLILLLSCHQASNIAPGGAQLLLSANPQQVGFNGTSQLTVIGTDENGLPLPDGTRVAFHVQEAGNVTPDTVQLINGTANATYHATFVAGDMTISATSGSVEATTTVTVSDNTDQNVFVSANPATFGPGGGTSAISAAVTDSSGSPIAGSRVQFTTTAGSLQSNGGTVTTNSAGIANDTLVTTETATVTATTDRGFSGQVTVEVGSGRIVCHMTASPANPAVGQTVSFFDTSDDPSMLIVRYHWDFGDGGSVDGKNVQHAYSSASTFSVVHSVVDAQGNTTFCDPFPITVH